MGSVNSDATGFNRIELIWPGKNSGGVPRQTEDGQWSVDQIELTPTRHPLVDLATFPKGSTEPPSLLVSGNRIDALNTIAHGFARAVKLAYLDLPRIEIDDKLAAFRGDDLRTYSSWLSVLQAHLSATHPLMRRDGVVVIHVGDTEEAYARLVADDIFGRTNRVATIVWQRSYGPRNMTGMKEFTATHDCLLVYAIDKSFLPPVGLQQAPSGYFNPDGDPRGSWKAEHKGARTRREKSDFNTYVPPYRWRITMGQLPKGLWRLNPLTGVIWGIPEEVGLFPITIQVKDSSGDIVAKKLILQSQASGLQAPPPDIPWLFDELETTGRLRITTKSLPACSPGVEYHAICLAQGGAPFSSGPKRPGSGRYWEFASDTLVRSYQKDAVYLGKDGSAIPARKKYLRNIGDSVVRNQMTWWPGREQNGKVSKAFVGYTEDATKHLKKLKELRLVDDIVTISKPELLMERLLEIFTGPEEFVLEVFGQTADLSAVAIKKNRRFVLLSGSGDRDRQLLERIAVPRLKAVILGEDQHLEKQDGDIRMRDDAYVAFGGGGTFVSARVGDWLFERELGEDIPRLNRKAYSDPTALKTAVLTAEGFLPLPSNMPDGESFDQQAAAVFVGPDDYLTPEFAANTVSTLIDRYQRTTIYYFRASEDFDASTLGQRVIARRIPMEINV